LRVLPPSTEAGIERYLASGLIRGIGPAYAKRLVAAFGTDVFSVIEATPAKLREINGIGEVRARRIVEGWADQRVIRDIMVFLHANGVSTSRAVRIFKTYGQNAIDLVKETPTGWRATSRASASCPPTPSPATWALSRLRSSVPVPASPTR